MSFDMAAAAAVLKDDYRDGIREQHNNDTFLTFIERRTGAEHIQGDKAVLALHTGRSGGYGARAEGGALPTPRKQGYSEERVGVYQDYHSIKFSRKLMKAAATDRGAFLRAAKSEMDGARNTLKWQVGRQVFGTSDGVLASCKVTTASTTVNLADATTSQQMRAFHTGQYVDIGTVASPTGVASAREVTGVSVANKTITISGAAVTTATTDRVFVSGNGGSGADQKEITGLATIVSDSGTLHNVDSSTTPIWKSTVNTTGGQPTEQLLNKVGMQAAIESGNEIEMWVCADGVYRQLGNNILSTKRIVNEKKLKAGYSGISVQGGGRETDVTWDMFATGATAYGLALSKLGHYILDDLDWVDEDGNILFRATDDSDAFQATLALYHELATDQRNAHAKCTGLTED